MIVRLEFGNCGSEIYGEKIDLYRPTFNNYITGS